MGSTASLRRIAESYYDGANHAYRHRRSLQASRDWITEAVRYRDQLSHESDFGGKACPMHLRLHHILPVFRFEELVFPAMPNGCDVETYFRALKFKLASYVRDSILMLPNVDPKHIFPDILLKPEED